jgi:hypothetical protein
MAAKRKANKAPWKRDNPKKNSSRTRKTLTGAEKAQARGRARRAGRPYPNLVDNMAVARKKPAKSQKSKASKGRKTNKTS